MSAQQCDAKPVRGRFDSFISTTFRVLANQAAPERMIITNPEMFPSKYTSVDQHGQVHGEATRAVPRWGSIYLARTQGQGTIEIPLVGFFVLVSTKYEEDDDQQHGQYVYTPIAPAKTIYKASNSPFRLVSKRSATP